MTQAYLDALTDSAMKAIDAVADDQGSHLGARRDALLAINQHASVAVTQTEQAQGYTEVMREEFFRDAEANTDD